MQVFAISKATALGIAIAPQLTQKYRHAVRIMKITGILILAACVHASANGISQTITLNVKNEPIQSVMKAIEKQTDYVFFYEAKLLKDAKKITIATINTPLQQVLELCFKDQSFTYSISGRYITIVPKKNEQQDVPAQNQPPVDIHGRITNERGEAVLASITVKGTTQGTTTNDKGEFQLGNVDENAILIISGVGIETVEIKVNGLKLINVVAKIATKPLDQVQMVAYGTTTKRFNTGNVTSVKSRDIETQPVSNPLLALQGRVPGLVITQGSGVPGSGITVRIQGRNSINAGNDPLYVIDGVPYPSQMLPTTTGGTGNILGTSGSSTLAQGGSGNPLSFVGVDNIESIEILKDADATSIYGSRGSNGVVLITTKKGSPKSKTKVDLNFRQGWGKVTRTLDMMNTEQYLEMRNEAMSNDGFIPSVNPADNGTAATGFRKYASDIKLWDSTRYTDWQKELTGGTAQFTDVNGYMSGGDTYTNYRIGGGFQRETTVFPGNFSNKKGTVNANINTQSQDRRFFLQFSVSYINDKNNLPRLDLTSNSLSLPPNAPLIYNSDGSLNWAPNPLGNSSWTNPLAQLYNKYENNSENLYSSFLAGYKITSNLEFKTQLGYNRLETDEFSGISILSQPPQSRSTFIRSAQYTSSIIKFYLVEPQLHYTRVFGKAKIDALLGTTVQQNQNKGEVINGTGYPTDDLERDIRSATSFTVPSSIETAYKYNALFSRINLNWKNKYILNLAGRRDGSSRFGPENRFHNFGSVGAAWILTEEKFLQSGKSWLSFGKLRASYGTTGNDQIGDYTYLDLYNAVSNAVPYQSSSSIAVNKIPNPYLQWEETRKLSLGLNLGFINDRILIDASFNRNRSSNQLISYSLPGTTGFSSIYVNLPAVIQNTSWEFSLNSMNIKKKNFNWETGFNFTIPENKLVSFNSIEQSTLNGVFFIGKPLSVTKAYHYLGVDPITGLYLFLDRNGNPTTSPTVLDRTVLLNTDPIWYGGIQNSFRFKRLEVVAFLQFVKQIQSSRSFLNFGLSAPGTAALNQPAAILDRWQKPGDEVRIQKYSTAITAMFSALNAGASDAAIVDASFLRLKNITASYDISGKYLKRTHIEKLRLFVGAQNLLTITKFKGIDPENQSTSSLAPLRILVVGVNAGF